MRIEKRTQKQSSLYEGALAEIFEEILGERDDLVAYLGGKSDAIALGVRLIRGGEIVLRWKWDPKIRRHTPRYEWAEV